MILNCSGKTIPFWMILRKKIAKIEFLPLSLNFMIDFSLKVEQIFTKKLIFILFLFQLEKLNLIKIRKNFLRWNFREIDFNFCENCFTNFKNVLKMFIVKLFSDLFLLFIVVFIVSLKDKELRAFQDLLDDPLESVFHESLQVFLSYFRDYFGVDVVFSQQLIFAPFFKFLN